MGEEKSLLGGLGADMGAVEKTGRDWEWVWGGWGHFGILGGILVFYGGIWGLWGRKRAYWEGLGVGMGAFGHLGGGGGGSWVL